jgi:ferredoxin
MASLTISLSKGYVFSMADHANKWKDNVKGRFYVDDQCIDCDACRTEAPEHFTRNNDHGYSYVFKQPSTEEELEHCKAALEACPVEAIGSDGS